MKIINDEIVAYDQWRTEMAAETQQLAQREAHLTRWRRELESYINQLANRLGYASGPRNNPRYTGGMPAAVYADEQRRLEGEAELGEYITELYASAAESERIYTRMEVISGKLEGLKGQIGALQLKIHNLEAALERYQAEYTRFQAVRNEHRSKAWTYIRELAGHGVRYTTDHPAMLRTALYFDILGSRWAREQLRTLLAALRGEQVRAALEQILPDLAVNDEQLRFVWTFVR